MKGEKLEITYINPAELKAYDRNARTHEPEQVAQIVRSIERLGFANPVLVDENNEIIAGHGRTLAALELGLTEVPAVVLRGLTATEKKALRLADNQIALTSGWDVDLLASEIAAIHAEDEDFDLDTLGFSEAELDGYLAQAEAMVASDKSAADDDHETGAEREVLEDEAPEPPSEVEVKTRPGDVWTLGEHRVMCGDSTDAEAVAMLMDGQKADLVFTDPPYGMKKEAEGVKNDNLNYDDLLEFNKRWIPLSFASLKANGSWYCWGTDEPLMDIYSNILKPMAKRNEITFRNLITWKKESDNQTMLFNGACASGYRSYYSNEKCLFVMSGVQGFDTNAENYFDGWEPVRKYLSDEAERVGLTPKDIKEICGVGMFSHWFTKSQWVFIPENHYRKIQEHYREHGAFKREYEEIKREYEEIKREYEEIKRAWYETRAYFDGTKSQNIDVWVHDVTSTSERALTGGHATPKPIALCARAIKSSSREGETVLDLFGGSGSTLIACGQLGRKARLMELDPRYVDVIINRWQTLTGGEAVRSDGVKYNDLRKDGDNACR